MARAYTCEAVYIAKGRYYAGTWSFAPNARGDDGLIHVIALKTARRRDTARFMLDLWRGIDPAHPTNFLVLTCKDLSITSDHPAAILADGDSVGVLPESMRVRRDSQLLWEAITLQR